MIRILKYSTVLTVLFFLSGCSFQSGLAPKSIGGRSISFFVEKVGGNFDKNLYHETVIFHFGSSGNYRTTLDGKFFQAGDYSYYPKGKDAKLLVTYSDSSSLYEYQFQMVFETPTSGKWSATFSNNPELLHGEMGSFEFVK